MRNVPADWLHIAKGGAQVGLHMVNASLDSPDKLEIIPASACVLVKTYIVWFGPVYRL